MSEVSNFSSDIYYESHGEGPAIVLVHGFEGNHVSWWQQVPHFRERHQVLVLDLPGFGLSRSKWGTYDMAEYPSCIEAVMDDAGIEKAAIVAQSWGCVPALRFTIDNPARVSSVVLNHQLGGIKDMEILERVGADRAEQLKLPELDRLLTKEFQAQQPDLLFLFEQVTTFNPELSVIGNMSAGFSSLEDVKKAITAGTNVTYVQGGRDTGTSQATYDHLRALLPEADYVYLEDAGHSTYWERPELFNATLDAVLEKVR